MQSHRRCVVLALNLLWKLSYARVFWLFSSNGVVFSVCGFGHFAVLQMCVECGHVSQSSCTFHLHHAWHSCPVFTALWCGFCRKTYLLRIFTILALTNSILLPSAQQGMDQPGLHCIQSISGLWIPGLYHFQGIRWSWHFSPDWQTDKRRKLTNCLEGYFSLHTEMSDIAIAK